MVLIVLIFSDLVTFSWQFNYGPDRQNMNDIKINHGTNLTANASKLYMYVYKMY